MFHTIYDSVYCCLAFYKLLEHLKLHSLIYCLSVSTHVEEYHAALLEGRPSVMDFIEGFLNSGESNFVHIALWILAQFSGGGIYMQCSVLCIVYRPM